MTVQITIEDVPESLRDRLTALASLRGQSLEDYLRFELKRIASRPTTNAWLRDVRAQKRADGTRNSAAEILRTRDADRR